LEILKESDPFLIGVTDTVLSPIAPFCDILFEVPEKFVTYLDTSAAYMALIHALSFGVYLKDPELSKSRVEKYDRFVKQSGYFTQNHLKLIEF
jgi:DNA-binding MurR/RpiR family transcriptional regulator